VGEQLISTFEDITERKKSEQILVKLQTAIESAKASIVITDNTGSIEYANPYFTQVTGYTKEEYIGATPKVLKSNYHPEEFYRELWNTIKSGKTWEGEFYNRKKSGELYWENAIISPIHNGNNEITHFVAVKTDITQHKKSEERFQTGIENAPIAIGIAVNMKYVYVNKSYFKLTGYTPEELIGRDITSLVAPEYLNVFTERATKRIQGLPVESSFEVTIIKKDNTRATLLMSASVIDYKNEKATFAFAQDVTETKKTEKELENYRNHLEELVEKRNKELYEEIEIRKTTEKILIKSESILKQAQTIAKLGSWELNIRGIFGKYTPRRPRNGKPSLFEFVNY